MVLSSLPHLINSFSLKAMSSRQDLQIWYQDPTTEAGVCVPEVVEEHHPGVGGGTAIDDGGGGGDDATPGVREALCLTFTLGSKNMGDGKQKQKYNCPCPRKCTHYCLSTLFKGLATGGKKQYSSILCMCKLEWEVGYYASQSQLDKKNYTLQVDSKLVSFRV